MQSIPCWGVNPTNREMSAVSEKAHSNSSKDGRLAFGGKGNPIGSSLHHPASWFQHLGPNRSQWTCQTNTEVSAVAKLLRSSWGNILSKTNASEGFHEYLFPTKLSLPNCWRWYSNGCWHYNTATQSQGAVQSLLLGPPANKWKLLDGLINNWYEPCYYSRMEYFSASVLIFCLWREGNERDHVWQITFSGSWGSASLCLHFMLNILTRHYGKQTLLCFNIKGWFRWLKIMAKVAFPP